MSTKTQLSDEPYRDLRKRILASGDFESHYASLQSDEPTLKLMDALRPYLEALYVAGYLQAVQDNGNNALIHPED